MTTTASSYTGDVTVGGPADVRELPGLTIAKLAVGSMDNNVYLLTCVASGERLLIDAAAEAPRLMHLLEWGPLERIVTTHQHADHWAALAEVVQATGAYTAAGRHDVSAIPVPTDDILDDGGTVQIGAISLGVISLVGHTPGSVALRYDDPEGDPHLFTGDSLFPGGPGRTTSPARFRSLMDDLEAKVFGAMPDETWVYPGHGRDTTLGAERPSLQEWRERGW